MKTLGLLDVKLPNGMVQRIPIESSSQFREVYVWKAYERIREVKPGDVVVDVGAMVGTFTLKAAAQGASRILAFEPFPPSFKILAENLERNKLDNVDAYRVALAQRNGEMKLWAHENPGSQSLTDMKDPEKFVMVPTRRLDDVLKEEEADHVDFIKIDVEGAEHLVLMGAKETLKRTPIHLGIAVYHYPEQLKEISTMLEGLGFKTHTLWNRYLFAEKN